MGVNITTENDYINGYLLKKASQYSIETPLIKSLYEHWEKYNKIKIQ